MRRQDIQLLAQARQGDAAARCEVGRRYLLGVDGFPQHVATALDYLQHPSLAGQPGPACTIAEGLPLQDLLALNQAAALQRAAAAGSAVAQVKLAAWCATRSDGLTEARHWLARAAQAGLAPARRGADALARLRDGADALPALLAALGDDAGMDGAAVARLAARQALAAADLPALVSALRAALQLAGGHDSELAALVADALRLAEASGQPLAGLPGEALRACLEQRATQGDRDAAFALGRGLCGIACAALPDAVFAEQQNMRKGAAFLLRAADAGCDAAWLHLYRLHGDHRLSVANPQLARFFLEKAALRGQAEAQRKLGALQLREASALDETEQAIHWLHLAASQGDGHAHTLLQSLVLPVEEAATEAAHAIEQVRRVDPWLAERLALARAFGLTRLEALCVDPVAGLRPWGLVVARNPFIAQARLAAPRAVPATSGEAMAVARRAAALFGHARSEGAAAEGDLRARTLRLRRVFERLGLDEAMFFSEATAMVLESLRLGAKWAYRARQPLQDALAA